MYSRDPTLTEMQPRDLMQTDSLIFPATIAGDSMLPTLRDGDWVLVRRTQRLRRGQIVAVRDPRVMDRILVKRIVDQRLSGWWVLGDNPDRSTDSRSLGSIPTELVLGRVLGRYYPLPLRWFGLF